MTTRPLKKVHFKGPYTATFFLFSSDQWKLNRPLYIQVGWSTPTIMAKFLNEFANLNPLFEATFETGLLQTTIFTHLYTSSTL